MDVAAVVLIVLNVAVLAAKVWAFLDSARFSAEEFGAAQRMPRTAWLLVNGANIVLQFWLGGFRLDEPFGPRSVTWLAGLLVLAVYVRDMRPRLLRARAGLPMPE